MKPRAERPGAELESDGRVETAGSDEEQRVAGVDLPRKAGERHRGRERETERAQKSNRRNTEGVGRNDDSGTETWKRVKVTDERKTAPRG